MCRSRPPHDECLVIADLGVPEGVDRDAIGIVIVDHGSRRQEANRRHESFVALWQTSIWYNKPWIITLKSTVDGLIYALCTAAVFGWLWPAY